MINNEMMEMVGLDRREVIFRYSIDETEPEAVVVSITKERWEREGKPTELRLVLENPLKDPKESDE